MTTKCLHTVTIEGDIIARFVTADDAAFFAAKMNEADMFALTNPGATAKAYDHRGALIEPARYTTR